MPTFIEAFDGKSVELQEKLNVTDRLLSKLLDSKLINKHKFNEIRIISEKAAKVECLLDVLRPRDDSLFEVFCTILEEEDQAHLVKILQNDNVGKRVKKSDEAVRIYNNNCSMDKFRH